MMMKSSHLMGNQAAANRYAEGLLVDAGHNAVTVRNFCFQIDRRTVATAVLCRVLWLQGLPDQATAWPRNWSHTASGCSMRCPTVLRWQPASAWWQCCQIGRAHV